VLFIILYLRVFNDLLYDWLNNPDYSHGFLIPIMALYIAWSKRDILERIHPAPSGWGLAVLLVGIGQYILGNIGAEHFLQSTSMIIVILGIVLFLRGWRTMRIILAPSLFLIFMIPLPAIIWNKFAFGLKLFATKIAVVFMQAMGLVVLREGNVLTLPATTLEVVDACSGLRSLISLAALSTMFGLLSLFSLWKKWLLFILVVPVAIASNIIRLIVITVFAEKFGIDITSGISHTVLGIFVFCIGLVLVWGVYKILSIIPSKAIVKV